MSNKLIFLLKESRVTMGKFKIELRIVSALLVLLLASVVIGYFGKGGINRLATTFKANEHTVILKSDGFYPEEITIKKGDSIKFSTALAEPFWPASDPHPTHDYLPNFDPKRPIGLNETWSYTFSTAKTWHYHDHLNVSFRGKINVLDNEGSAGVESSYCNGENDEEKLKCFDQKIRQAVEKGGVDAAFTLFTELYQSGQAPVGCHWTAHLIGEEAYKYFKKGQKFSVTSATAYCGYAFYHGFMEKLLREGAATADALKFCEEVNKQLGEEATDNCYHGIGHGFTEDPPDPNLWGNPNGMLQPGLKVCEELFGNTVNKWEICATGVYTVVASFMSQGKYSLSLNHNDPFAFCRTQPHRYDRACYGEFSPKLDVVTNWDISKVDNFIKDMADQSLVELIVRTAVGPMMQRDVNKEDLTNYVQNCRKLSANLSLVCLRGVVWGLAQHGEPEKEYVKILKFCSNSPLNTQEKKSCYQEASDQFYRMYSSEKVASICNEVTSVNRSDCLGEH